jgi:hypothetical protein
VSFISPNRFLPFVITNTQPWITWPRMEESLRTNRLDLDSISRSVMWQLQPVLLPFMSLFELHVPPRFLTRYPTKIVVSLMSVVSLVDIIVFDYNSVSRNLFCIADRICFCNFFVKFDSEIYSKFTDMSPLRLTAENGNFDVYFRTSGTGVAQSVYCLTTDWTTGRSRFDPRQRQAKLYFL